MLNLLQSATDDQTALGVCILTMFGASVLVFASFHLGPAGRKLRRCDRQSTELKMVPRSSVESKNIQERAA
jgi:hypothetical protein